MLAFDTLFSCQGARFLARAQSRSPGLKANAPTDALVRGDLEGRCGTELWQTRAQ